MFTNAERIIEEGILEQVSSGAALGIISGGEVIYENYFGHVSFEEGAKEVDENTMFDLASVSKIFSTTSIALRFLDRGLFRLHDTVGFFLPEATELADITIKELLTHTSGQAASYQLQKVLDSPVEIRNYLLTTEASGVRGETKYSCMGMIILGEILKEISGKTLDVLFEEEVKDVLGIDDAAYGPINTKEYSVAITTDTATGNPLEGIVHDENARFQNGVSANAGLFSTLNDLLVYTEALYNFGFADNDDVFISPASLEYATRNHTEGLSENRGLGFLIFDDNNSSYGDLLTKGSFGHTGFTGTSVVVDKEHDLAVVFLSNRVINTQDHQASNRLRARLHNSIVADISADLYE